MEQFKRSGNNNIVAELFDRYIEMTYAVCLKYLEDAETSKDAVMEVYGQLEAKLLKHEVTNFRGWLYTLVKNHCLMQLRSSSRNQPVNLNEERVQLSTEMHPYSGIEKELQLNQLSECMETLPGEQKQIINLFYLQEKSYKEIAGISGMDWNKVRSMVQNGRRNLKICIEKRNMINTDKE